MSDKMKIAVFRDVRKIELEEADIPLPKGKQILVRLKACAICTWEQRVYTGVKKVEFPFIGGHEMVGEIVELGEGVDNKIWKKGDRVAIGVMLACGQCYYCQIGEHGCCENFNHSKHLDGLPYRGMGGLSQYMLVCQEDIFRIENVSDEEATITEPLSCVINSVETGDPRFGQNVLVIGCGIMGLLHVILAAKKGATVIACDVNEQRLELAKSMGARYTINPAKEDLSTTVKSLTHHRGADIVFDTTPIADLVKEAFKSVSMMGKIVLYSSFYPDVPIEFSPDWVHKKSIQILGTANSSRNDFIKAAKMISDGTVDMKPFVSEVYNFSEITEALESAAKADKFRVVVKL
ncbi:MAG: zinc-dependent alcohol dehydrogenase [Bacillota bacterium]